MTRSDRTFPVGPRLLALGAAIAALLICVPIAGAAAPTKSQVQSMHAAYLKAEAQIREYRSEIESVQIQLNAAVEKLDRLQAELEQIQAQIAETKARIADAQARYDRIRSRLEERAAQAFIAGPASDLEIFLGATSMDDLSDRMEFVDAVTQSDAALAQQASNLKVVLEIEEKSLEELEAKQQDQVDQQTALRDQILQSLSTISSLRDQAVATAQNTLEQYKRLNKQRQDYLEQQAQSSVSPPAPDVQLPPGFVNPLKVCPVDPPRAFGDGFGAPRYTGDFHLHAGDDILADYGTKIRAPFDGVAKPTYNSLGGNSEYVYAPDGSYVYNAHLESYTDKSSGPVHAGDVIGLVGDTGDAKGTPHDHFEWHPASVPANWPASFYGYVTIPGTSAVNPYPVLNDVCN
ncbi:MAG TPA: peptidoglycan DD-metalloendopeptidase family protein [Actinomycetota bacterium]|jgi:murein DD-endopeptidase MepM/ murein hydrolase activator NlpD|nr:peptidoglycan DD-metalloendopeptidase family protein [Actinomycetota bacterium]